MDLCEVPCREADLQQREMPIAAGNFEAATFNEVVTSLLRKVRRSVG